MRNTNCPETEYGSVVNENKRKLAEEVDSFYPKEVLKVIREQSRMYGDIYAIKMPLNREWRYCRVQRCEMESGKSHYDKVSVIHLDGTIEQIIRRQEKQRILKNMRRI